MCTASDEWGTTDRDRIPPNELQILHDDSHAVFESRKKRPTRPPPGESARPDRGRKARRPTSNDDTGSPSIQVC